MVSIIKVTSVQDTSGNNETTTANIKKAYDGSAKVWLNYNTSTSTSIRESFNVSSLTDVGVGLTTVAFTSSMNTSTYSVPSGGGNGRTGGNNTFTLGAGNNAGGAPSASDIHLLSSNQGGTVTDGSDLCIAAFGDLA